MSVSTPHSTASENVTSRAPAVIEYFIHPCLFESHDTLYRARIFVATMFFLATVFGATVVIQWFGPVTPVSRAWGAGINATAFALVMAALATLKQTGRYRLCCTVVISTCLIALLLASCITGGTLHSPAAQLLVIPPLMAYFFLSMRGGNRMTLLTALSIVALMAAQHGGVLFPQTIRDEHLGTARAIILVVEFSVIALIAFTYEHTSDSLRIARDVEHQKVKQLAHVDALTGLANRRVFDAAVQERINQHDPNSQATFALGYVDLDGFKPINDTHGHDIGDQVLRVIAARLTTFARNSELVARHGGDEFMLLLDHFVGTAELEARAAKLSKSINEPIETTVGQLRVGGSLGFALYPTHARGIESLKRAADNAMYEAKRETCGWKLADEFATEMHPHAQL